MELVNILVWQMIFKKVSLVELLKNLFNSARSKLQSLFCSQLKTD